MKRATLSTIGMAGTAAALMFAAPVLLSAFWISVLIGAVTTVMLALGVGVLYWRVGLVSLSQVALFAVGMWVTMRIGFATSLPYPLLLVVSGLVTLGIGVAIGLPALRLRGIYLALVTLFAAQTVSIVLGNLQFPNGGGGFSGVATSISDSKLARRPSFAGADVAYLRFAVVVAALLFALVWIHVRGKPGRAWASIRQSEAAAESAGINITVYKLWAFALASFIAGVAGGVSAGHLGSANPTTYGAVSNILLFAVVVISGAVSLWGALIAGALKDVLPQFFDKTLHISERWSYILFGVGVLASLMWSTRAARRKGVSW